MSPLAAALAGVVERVGDVVAPRLREIARDVNADRARAALAVHLQARPDLLAEVAALDAVGASALLRELGIPAQGQTPREGTRRVRVEVLLSEEEAVDLDRQRGVLGRSEWMARAGGLRSDRPEVRRATTPEYLATFRATLLDGRVSVPVEIFDSVLRAWTDDLRRAEMRNPLARRGGEDD